METQKTELDLLRSRSEQEKWVRIGAFFILCFLTLVLISGVIEPE
jgi:hypothetical protein